MGDNVWMRAFVQVATFLSSLFADSNNQNAQNNGIASPIAPESAVPSISTSTNVTTLVVTRDPKKATTDALFGDMAYNGEWICYTMERTAVAIPVGTYKGYKRDSAHFGMRVVGIDVTNRTNIECHPANKPSELEGCIAVGSAIDSGALDNSRAAFDRMMAVLPEEFTVVVTSL